MVSSEVIQGTKVVEGGAKVWQVCVLECSRGQGRKGGCKYYRVRLFQYPAGSIEGDSHFGFYFGRCVFSYFL